MLIVKRWTPRESRLAFQPTKYSADRRFLTRGVKTQASEQRDELPPFIKKTIGHDAGQGLKDTGYVGGERSNRGLERPAVEKPNHPGLLAAARAPRPAA
jgi:hypothetical protein